jgi:hypothetical protein
VPPHDVHVHFLMGETTTRSDGRLCGLAKGFSHPDYRHSVACYGNTIAFGVKARLCTGVDVLNETGTTRSPSDRSIDRRWASHDANMRGIRQQWWVLQIVGFGDHAGTTRCARW